MNENVSQGHFVYHKSHMDYHEIKPCSERLATNCLSPDNFQSRLFSATK